MAESLAVAKKMKQASPHKRYKVIPTCAMKDVPRVNAYTQETVIVKVKKQTGLIGKLKSKVHATRQSNAGKDQTAAPESSR